MTSEGGGIVEGVVVGGVVYWLGGGGFTGIETVRVAVAGTGKSGEFCGRGQYRKGYLEVWSVRTGAEGVGGGRKGG